MMRTLPKGIWVDPRSAHRSLLTIVGASAVAVVTVMFAWIWGWWSALLLPIGAVVLWHVWKGVVPNPPICLMRQEGNVFKLSSWEEEYIPGAISTKAAADLRDQKTIKELVLIDHEKTAMLPVLKIGALIAGICGLAFLVFVVFSEQQGDSTANNEPTPTPTAEARQE